MPEVRLCAFDRISQYCNKLNGGKVPFDEFRAVDVYQVVGGFLPNKDIFREVLELLEIPVYAATIIFHAFWGINVEKMQVIGKWVVLASRYRN